jgi:hypothetical protein
VSAIRYQPDKGLFMSRRRCLVVFAAVTMALPVLTGCQSLSTADRPAHPIVGAAPGAPFEYHMFLFSADGTMLQSNPDAGDPHTSDSNGIGAWVEESRHVTGRFVEVTADRSTYAFVSRGEISFGIEVAGDAFHGRASALFYGRDGALTRGPVAVPLDGTRVRAR